MRIDVWLVFNKKKPYHVCSIVCTLFLLAINNNFKYNYDHTPRIRHSRSLALVKTIKNNSSWPNFSRSIVYNDECLFEP